MPDAIERALAHGEPDNVRRAYDRAEYWAERQRLMQWWADYLDAIKGEKVVTLQQLFVKAANAAGRDPYRPFVSGVRAPCRIQTLPAPHLAWGKERGEMKDEARAGENAWRSEKHGLADLDFALDADRNRCKRADAFEGEAEN